MNHIEAGSTRIHDKETTHKRLVSTRRLVSHAYTAGDLIGLKDSDNPRDPVNDIHHFLKKFLNAHSGFNQTAFRTIFSPFVWVQNPPCEMLEKVEKVLNPAFNNPKFLRARSQFGLDKGFES